MVQVVIYGQIPMPISDKTIQTLQKVNGVCKNWRDEISKSEDCRPSNYNDPNDMQNNTQGQSPNSKLQENIYHVIQRGDDLN